jgi:hypothetical protein
LKTRTNVSIDSELLNSAKKRAKKKGFSFSGYIAHLINNDLEGTSHSSPTNDLEFESDIKLDNKVNSAINSILDI